MPQSPSPSSLPANIVSFLANVERSRNYADPTWLASVVAGSTLWERFQATVRRKRFLVAILVLSSPWLYQFLRERLYKSGLYRSHRARNESFSRHLAKAEQDQLQKATKSPFAPDKVKVAVDGEFLRKLRVILAVVIPRWRCKEMWMLGLHSLFLIARTYLSVVVARLDGKIVKELVFPLERRWYW